MTRLLAAIALLTLLLTTAPMVARGSLDDAQATLDAAATTEAIDLTEIAGGESAVLTEQADEATQAAAIIQTAFPSPTDEAFDAAEIATPVPTRPEVHVVALPNTGTGGR